MDKLHKEIDEKQKELDSLNLTSNEEILNLQTELNKSESKIDALSKSLNDAKVQGNETIQELQKWKSEQKQHENHIAELEDEIERLTIQIHNSKAEESSERKSKESKDATLNLIKSVSEQLDVEDDDGNQLGGMN